MSAPARFQSGRCHSWIWWTFLCLPALVSPSFATAKTRTGELIYRQQCASCHGTSGEGTEANYPMPLAGDRSVDKLTRLIAKSMPKDDPGTCTGEDARKVAAYIFDAFYSPAARARNKAPRVELARLTVRQYRNAVADLIGSFRGPSHWDAQHGLRGRYFASRHFWRGRPVFERTDPTVRFDFGEAGPATEKFDPHQFSIRWQGSVLAGETGEYEFIVRTGHAARLWVNDVKRPLVDAWVKSGNDTEYRAAIFLVGGRAYPLRLDFSKAKQGVDDSKTNKPKPSRAFITLEWKPPNRAVEPIPARSLSPNPCPETFVVTTPFPPDDRSTGYERGTFVSKAWDRATTEAAIDAAGYLAAHLNELAGTSDAAPDRPARVRDFCRRFAERAFRRPLTAEVEKLYISRRFEHAPTLEAAVKRVVLLVLQSPRFLYQKAKVGDAYDVASRLSFGLWDSLPDRELLEAAAQGRLATREQVARQAERMLKDQRAQAKVHDFLLQWLKIDPAPDLAKDAREFPGFNRAVASDLRTSLELFLEDVVWGEPSDFRQLLSADYLYLNGRLARLYGADLPADAPFRKITLKPGRRAGVLSHPYLMATFAHSSASSPIHRGVFLTRNILGRMLRPPPEAFTPLEPTLHPLLTTRERVTLQTRSRACQTCHGLINPLGFTLENFDAIGRFRDKEKERPIDVTGSYEMPAGRIFKFEGVRGLSAFLAGSPEVHDAFVEQLFHYLIKQPVRAFGSRTKADLRGSFVSNHYSIRKLLVEIMAVTALGPADEKRKKA
jgi:hypothetical protein